MDFTRQNFCEVWLELKALQHFRWSLSVNFQQIHLKFALRLTKNLLGLVKCSILTHFGRFLSQDPNFSWEFLPSFQWSNPYLASISFLFLVFISEPKGVFWYPQQSPSNLNLTSFAPYFSSLWFFHLDLTNSSWFFPTRDCSIFSTNLPVFLYNLSSFPDCTS